MRAVRYPPAFSQTAIVEASPWKDGKPPSGGSL